MIEQTLERIATALETIAGNQPTNEKPESRTEPDALEERSEKTELSREEIKAKAKELGIEFAPTTRTETLLKKIEECSEKEPKGDGEESLPIEEQLDIVEPQEVKKVASMDQTKDVLMRYASKNGNDKVREILTKYNAKKLSDLSDTDRTLLVREIGE